MLDERNLRSLKRKFLSPRDEVPSPIRALLSERSARSFQLAQARDAARVLLHSAAATFEFSTEVFVQSITDQQLACFLGRKELQRMQAAFHREDFSREFFSWFSFLRENPRNTSGRSSECWHLHQQQRRVLEEMLLNWMPPKHLFTSAQGRHSGHLTSRRFASWSLAANAGVQALDDDEDETGQHFAAELRASASELREVVGFQPSGQWPVCVADVADSDTNLATRLVRSPALWRLSQNERVVAVQAWTAQSLEQVTNELEVALERVHDAAKDMAQTEHLVELEILKSVNVVGMTVTGASIHAELLRHWRPQVVIVEEAAEVLEPSLMALLGPSVRHLIQIGDHFQLPPKVEHHDLQVNHFFGTSMMERLICLKYPHRSLCAQGRMLPSMLDLIAPRYARAHVELTTYMKAITSASLTPPAFLGSEVFWWECTGNMTTGKSKCNEEEVERAIALAFYIVAQGVEPSKITILSTYLGQAALVKRRLAQEFPSLRERLRLGDKMQTVSAKVLPDLLRDGLLTVSDARLHKFLDVDGHPIVPGVYSASDVDAQGVRLLTPYSLLEEDVIKVCTVDRYQGDENDFVIVSFVRSKCDEKEDESQTIGFLGTPEGGNRLLVALSRARRGLYLIGNSRVLETGRGRTDHWKELFQMLRRKLWIGRHLLLRCPRHPAQELRALHHSDIDFAPCRQSCEAQMECGIVGHVCSLPCHPKKLRPRSDPMWLRRLPILPVWRGPAPHL